MSEQTAPTRALASEGRSLRALARGERSDAVTIYASIGLQLVGLLIAAARWDVESDGFQSLLVWTGAGFAVHYWLPRPKQAPFFVALSLGAAAGALGAAPAGWNLAAALEQAAALLTGGCALIYVCHVPLSARVRCGLLVAAGLFLAVLRASSGENAPSSALWAVLGSMFMFRIVGYAAEVAQGRAAPAPSQSLAYFFMLPNVFCGLFPVVDWKAFQRDYFNREPVEIYQKGLRWMARGLVHLVLYRVIHRHVYIDPSEVSGGASLARYLVGNYGLYLHVSGLFHWLVGTLHLFGWNLPETNHQYYLAESFTDYWRRVNIYWKDFMLGTVFNPVALRLRRTGTVWAVVIGSMAAFVVTWALHGYQTFWLTGELRFSLQDALFWGTLGVLVMLNAGREARRPARKLLKALPTWREAVVTAARTSGVFAVLCVLWSLWSAESLQRWLALWQHVDAEFVRGAAQWLALVAAAKVWVERAPRWREAWRKRSSRAEDRRDGRAQPFAGLAATCGLSLALVSLGHDGGLPRLMPERLARAVAGLARRASPEASGARPARGYYEKLLSDREGSAGVAPPAGARAGREERHDGRGG